MTLVIYGCSSHRQNLRRDFATQETDEGYWLPKDAEADDDTNYISNNYLRNKIKAMSAKNILLVADSCFSGSLVTRGISLNSVAEDSTPNSALEKYVKTKSRIAITSGGLKPVMDGGGGQHSVFAICFNYNVLTHDMLGRMVPRRRLELPRP